ncbi:MAG: TonB-dependent receptor [Acidobacteria bacterium]|nr:TonB-dependent receptor [Acidobacteriota bacterium]
MDLSTLALLLNVALLGQPAAQITGTVVDSQGAAVANANVRLELNGVRLDEIRTTTDGGFAFRLTAAEAIRLVVSAPGFADATVTLPADLASPVRIELQPAPFFETLNITSSRSHVIDLGALVTMTVFSSPDLLTNAPLAVDDALKIVPGFTLLHRTSSRVSHPTTQGISLRGLGGTAASRSLVLVDGVPLNDAFGGWIYWNKVPHIAIDRVEVLRGGGSDLYGADAASGVVQIVTFRPGRVSARALVEGGNLHTGRVSVFGGGRTRGWFVSGAGEWFRTRGYIPAAEDQRGVVDTRAGSDHQSAIAAVSYQAGNGWKFEARGGLFSEDRTNGTPLQVNDTDARQGSVEVSGAAGRGLLLARAFGETQGFDQAFSILSTEPARESETLDRMQRVPTTVAGATIQWERPWGRHSLLVGGDARFISGHTVETRFSGGLPVATTDEGGRQQVGSVFARAAFVGGDRVTVVAAAHADAWHSASQSTSFGQTLGAFNPRASVAYRFGETGLTLRGSVYRSFRAPTLNELYRGFRAGNNVVIPNEALEPERLTAGEVGLAFSRGRAAVRATGFWNLLDETITNVTISTSPTINLHERQNADTVRSIGLELEGDLRMAPSVTLAVTSAVIDARFKGRTRLRDFRVPQIPAYTLGLNLRYAERGWTLSGQLRLTGSQFEDDVNTLRLRRATVADVFGGRTIARRVTVFGAIENLFDTDYDVARTPTRMVGLPRAARTGVQLAIP